MKLQLYHRLRWLWQLINPPDISVAGGYHYGNAGDILLGSTVIQLLKKYNRSTGLQTIYGLSRWPKASKIILGGGAIGYDSPLKELMNSYPNPLKVQILGVDFNQENYDEETITYLKEVPYIVTRSNTQKGKLKKLLCRDDIIELPDLAFCWCQNKIKGERLKAKSATLIVNLVPIYMQRVNNLYIPLEQYRYERPEIYPYIESIFMNYLSWAKRIVDQYRKIGFQILAIPFTPADEELMVNLPWINKSEVLPYQTNLEYYLGIMANSSTFLTTRFHATLIGIRCLSDIIPFAYASKNEELLKEMGAKENQYLTPMQIIDKIPESLKPFIPQKELIEKVETKAFSKYTEMIESFMLN